MSNHHSHLVISEQVASLQQQLAEALEQNLVLSKQTDHTILDLSNYVDGLEQQLAAALAACKLKDSAIQHIISGALSLPRFAEQQAKEALTIQPDDSALKAWIGEPVAWKHDDPKRHDAITDSVKELLHRANSEYMHRPIDKTEHYTIPLYSPKGLK